MPVDKKEHVCVIIFTFLSTNHCCTAHIFFLFQLLLKISASDVFHGKKSCYLTSVPKPFVTSHLCEWIIITGDQFILCSLQLKQRKLPKQRTLIPSFPMLEHKYCDDVYFYILISPLPCLCSIQYLVLSMIVMDTSLASESF